MRRFDSATRKRWPKELGLAELDILVFYLKDPSGRCRRRPRSAFENANSDVGRLAKIRIGDLYRLLGRAKEAVDQYQSVQKTVQDETQGREKSRPSTARTRSPSPT